MTTVALVEKGGTPLVEIPDVPTVDTSAATAQPSSVEKKGADGPCREAAHRYGKDSGRSSSVTEMDT